MFWALFDAEVFAPEREKHRKIQRYCVFAILMLIFVFRHSPKILLSLLQKHRKYHCFGFILGFREWENIARTVVLSSVGIQNTANNNNNNHPTQTHSLFPGTAGGCVSSWITFGYHRRPPATAHAADPWYMKIFGESQMRMSWGSRALIRVGWYDVVCFNDPEQLCKFSRPMSRSETGLKPSETVGK